MGRKTSVYLSDDLLKRWRASKMPLSEHIRRSLDALDGAEPPPSLDEIRRAFREEVSGLSVAADRTSPYSGGYSSEPYEEIP